ncbi:MAG: DUF5011 domain-containing protein [Lachnospiraceae bacterium]|nr:DUF5011 domain-containing protein [Lachnospiraceae bacterium]
MIVANLLLLGICGFGFARLDMQAPVVKFPGESPVYRADITDAELLSGVTAYDNLDKDVTKRLVIEKVSVDPSGEKAIVYYAVSDRRGNAARVSREIPAEGLKTRKETEELLASAPAPEPVKGETADPSEDIEDEIGEDGEEGTAENAETAPSPEKTKEPVRAEAPVPPVAAPAPPAAADPVAAQAAAVLSGDPAGEPAIPSAADMIQPVPDPAAIQSAAIQQAADPAAIQPEAQTVSSGETQPTQSTPIPGSDPPVLTLKTGTVTVPVGTRPAWVNVIGQMTDDKDSYNTLFRNLSVGSFDVNIPGTYTVSLQTQDSDGNPSASCPLTIVVQ